MPNTILILSDMEFNACARVNETAMQSIRRQYEEAGSIFPRLFSGILLLVKEMFPCALMKKDWFISGFSSSIMKSLLQEGEVTPKGIMLGTVMSDRYSLPCLRAM